MFTKTALFALASSSLAFALPASQPVPRESPTTWQVTNYGLTNDTGNGYTYSFEISGEAPWGGFDTFCTGSTVQAGLEPCIENPGVTAVVYSTGVVDGIETFELQAAFAGASGESVAPGPSYYTSFEITFVEA